MIEDFVEMDKEIVVIVVCNESGQIQVFLAVEMAFNLEVNLVEFLFCLVNINKEVEVKVEVLAVEVINVYGICGLLVVELFLDKEGNFLVNEVVFCFYNSGYYMIDSCYIF